MRVRLFASLRELAGTAVLELEPDAPDVGALLDQLSARYGEEFVRIMSVGTVVVDGETAERSRRLAPDADVALLPPVSGGLGAGKGTGGPPAAVREERDRC
jgi:MoaD family protein